MKKRERRAKNRVAALLERILCRGKEQETQTCRALPMTERERARETYYMNNFWSYDGSEQQEWDEEG